MKSSNITIKIKSDLACEATLFAARRGISLSRLVEEQLETVVREDQAYAAARQRALHQLKKGFDLGWKQPADRKKLHKR